MTLEALLAIALTCPTLPPSMAPIMAGIALHESAGNPNAVHQNTNGTVDIGLAQVNSSNFGWLGLTAQTALDPCTNLAAGARVLFARYNGNPPDAIKAVYAARVMAQLSHLPPTVLAESTPAAEPPVVYIRPAHAGRNLVYAN